MAAIDEKLAQDIRKIAESGTALMGVRETLKALRAKSLAKVFLAKNAEKENRADVMHYAQLAGTEVVDTTYTGDELGIICKRQHSVTILGVKK